MTTVPTRPTAAVAATAAGGVGRDEWVTKLRAPVRSVLAWAVDRPERMLLASNTSGDYRVHAWDRAADAEAILPREAKPGYTFVSRDGGTVYHVRGRGAGPASRSAAVGAHCQRTLLHGAGKGHP